MTTMFAHGLQVLSNAAAIFLGFAATLVVAVVILRSSAQQLLVLSAVVLVAGAVLVTLAAYAASQPQPPFNPDFTLAIIALACTPCVVGTVGLLLWVRRRKH
jgi:hypothetical protein